MSLFGGRNIMVDLETLALTSEAAILQIGAVAFYPDEPEREFERFNVHVSLRSNLALGRTVDPETLLWWMDDVDGAGAEARQEFVRGQRVDPQDLIPAVMMFSDFCRFSKGRRGALGSTEEGPARIWGHGPTFDVTKLETAYDRAGLKYPWGHRAIRDTRTLMEATGVDMGNPSAGGHIAVEDADHQARRVLEAIDVLKQNATRT